MARTCRVLIRIFAAFALSRIIRIIFMTKQIFFTKSGFQKLTDELQQLQTNRKSALKNLQEARSLGDLSENGAYRAARWKLSSIDRRIRYLEKTLRFAVVKEIANNDLVQIGSFVTILLDDKKFTYEIVGGHESDISLNKISCYSPLGKALLNKKINDRIIVRTPSGERTYFITTILPQTS